MDLLFIVLQKIYLRPEMFISKKSISNLYLFILGYRMRALEDNSKYKDCMDEFTEFVQIKYNDKYQVLHWKELILKNSNSEEDAFEVFFCLMKEHLQYKYQPNGMLYLFNVDTWRI